MARKPMLKSNFLFNFRLCIAISQLKKIRSICFIRQFVGVESTTKRSIRLYDIKIIWRSYEQNSKLTRQIFVKYRTLISRNSAKLHPIAEFRALLDS